MLKWVLVILMIVQLTACGTILYPERIGQRSGHIDAKVVILDGVGLFFFVVPGLIAFAVDFYNGTIYLPGGRRFAQDNASSYKLVRTDETIDMKYLETVIEKKCGVKVALDQKLSEIKRVDSLDGVRLL